MSEQILFYKKTCPHCKKLFELLQKSPRLMSAFLIICVDDKRYRIPKQIKSVPSAIITSPTGEPQVFSGTNLFHWVKNRIHSQGGQGGQGAQGGSRNPDPRYQQHQQRQMMQKQSQQQQFKELEPQEWDSFMMNNLSGNFAFIEDDKNEVVVDKQGYASLNNLNNFRIMTPEDDGMKNKGDIKPVAYSTDDDSLRVPYQQSNSNPFADSRAGGGQQYQQQQHSSTNYNPNQYSNAPNMSFDPNMFRDQNYEGNDSRANSRKSQFDSQMEAFKNARDMGMPQPLRRM